MREFSSNILTEMNTRNARSFFCMYIKDALNNVILASTTHVHDVTLDDGITYVSDDRLIAVEPPQISTTVDREEYKITIAGIDFIDTIGTEGDLVGCDIQVALCFINSTTGLPYVNEIDRLVFYKGKLSFVAAEIDTSEQGEATFSIGGASPMMALEMSKGIYLSRDYMRSKNENDSCCDTIYEGSSALVLKWGRI